MPMIISTLNLLYLHCSCLTLEEYFLYRAPVHVITGSAGCQEGRDHFKRHPHLWSAFQSQDWGYTKLKAYNNTHINIEQVSVDLGGQVIDQFWLVKENVSRFYNLP